MSLSLNIAVTKQRFRHSKPPTCLYQSQVDIITDLHSSKHSMASISRNTMAHVNTIRRIVKQHSQHNTVSAKITRNRNIPIDLYKQWFTEYIDTVTYQISRAYHYGQLNTTKLHRLCLLYIDIASRLVCITY